MTRPLSDLPCISSLWCGDRLIDRRQVRRVGFPYYLGEETLMNEVRKRSARTPRFRSA